MRPAEPIARSATRPLRRAVLRPFLTVAEMERFEPQDAVAYGVRDEAGGLVAVGLVGPEGEPGAWRIRGMATAPGARGRGAGGAVLAALAEHAVAAGATRLWCHARTPARTLYERAGFRAISEEWDEPRIGPHVVMERRL